MKQTNILIIGSGIAGLATALRLQNIDKITIVTKGELKEANTYWAQGGVAAVMTKEDSFIAHQTDTLKAGCDHNNPEAVRHLVQEGPNAIRWLQEIGVKFQEEPVLEAGHSHPRVWHTSDFTGQDILNALIKRVKKAKNIEVLEHTEVVELITHQNQCRGAWVRASKDVNLTPLMANQVVLATGGLGQLFARTTNTLGSAGEGVAMGLKAGLKMKDLEFVQFHPTAFAEPTEGRYFLLSEALRGAGAKILNADGNEFLKEYDARAELAPRDILTRVIHFEQINGPIYLSMRHLDAKTTQKSFPNIAKFLKKKGYDLTRDFIPITPVAHFACGGIPVDLQGATTLPGLYAVGEVAHTGVHGANRLASNSLLEALVFAQNVAESIRRSGGIFGQVSTDLVLEPPVIVLEEINQVKAYARRIGQIMWNFSSIVRTPDGLEEARREIATIPARDYRIQNRQQVCNALLEACQNRSHSLGAHYITAHLG